MKPKIKPEYIPDGGIIKGLGPIGVVWHAVWNKSKGTWKPDHGLPASEFAALTFNGAVIDIPANENYIPFELS